MKSTYVGFTRGLALCSLSLVILVGGCVHLKQKNPVRVPLTLPEALAAQVSYPKSLPHVLCEQVIETREKFSVAQFYLESFVPAYGTNKLLTVEWYLPQGVTNARTMLGLPVSAGNKYPLERMLGPSFARHGYVYVLIHREDLKGLDQEDPRIIKWLLVQSLLDERRVLDWIETRVECNARHIGVLGVSMGAIKGSLLVAVDERVRAAVLVLGGADLAHILAHSKEGAWQKRKKHSVERDRGIAGRREAYMKKYSVTRKEFEQRIRASDLVWAPESIGQYADPEKVKLVNALCDDIIPFRDALALRHALGDPEMDIILSGHYTSVLYLSYIERIAREFFEKRFSE